MVLYNVTVIIEETTSAEWLDWMNTQFIPEAMASNLIVSKRLLKVVDSPNEGITYCLQFIMEDMSAFQDFQKDHFTQLMEKHSLRFNNRFVSFNTLMEFID